MIIETNNLTKDYGMGRGIFDISLKVKKGEVFGFLGPNGAGKSTTVRHLLGYIKPRQGSSKILNMDTWSEQQNIQKYIGYVPGEIAFPNNLTGSQLINNVANLRNMTDLTRANELIKYFEIDTRGNLKRMSKGMKQKIALVIAFMDNPSIVILDEPTSGLDPLMQEKFVDLINAEKLKGTTIFMSSHIFSEIEKTCDRVAIIKDGRIVNTVILKDIEHNNEKTFEMGFKNLTEMNKFISLDYKYTLINKDKNKVVLTINDSKINQLFVDLNESNLVYFTEHRYNLEKYFMKYYSREDKKCLA